jgi:hypothetical protein
LKEDLPVSAPLLSYTLLYFTKFIAVDDLIDLINQIDMNDMNDLND